MLGLLNLIRKLARAEQGNVVMIFALSLIPIIAVAGSAIDINRVQTAKIQTAALLDQAVLAATNLSSTEDPSTLVQTWMNSQIEQFGYSRESLTMQVNSVVALNSKSVTATATLTVDTAIMHMFGTDETTIEVHASAFQSIPNIEIAMVLDISSSMRGSRLTSLKAASTEFVDIMLNETTEDATSINVVPFGGTVNIGTTLFN